MPRCTRLPVSAMTRAGRSPRGSRSIATTSRWSARAGLRRCARAPEASRLSDELGARFPAATLTARIHRPVIAAALAVSQRDFARAIRLLDPVKPYDHAPAAEFWPAYLRGEAYLGTEGWSGGRCAVSEHPGSPGRSAHVAVVCTGTPRCRSCRGAGGRQCARRARCTRRFSPSGASADDSRLIDESRREYARLQ